MDPNVSPVAISSVVYVRSLTGRPKAAEVGQTATIFVTIFTANSKAMIVAMPLARAGEGDRAGPPGGRRTG